MNVKQTLFIVITERQYGQNAIGKFQRPGKFPPRNFCD
jgi:hypothetical protein